MTATDAALQVDWLGLCRRATERLGDLLAGAADVDERASETGTRGAGGDRTLVLDQTAEAIVFDELADLHRAGTAFTAISEERGEQPFGGPPSGAPASEIRVVIDPIDGSTNAKREALHYALSLAVADGPAMADVRFGFVHDFGSGEQWWAQAGAGAWLAGGPARTATGGRPARLDAAASERRSADGRLELVGIEAADPRRLQASIGDLVDVAYRLRAVGSIAVTLCQVAAGRFDAMLTLRRCRGVDAAAGQLIVREAGGLVAFPECPAPLAAGLDATASSRLVAARSPEGLRAMAQVGG